MSRRKLTRCQRYDKMISSQSYENLPIRESNIINENDKNAVSLHFAIQTNFDHEQFQLNSLTCPEPHHVSWAPRSMSLIIVIISASRWSAFSRSRYVTQVPNTFFLSTFLRSISGREEFFNRPLFLAVMIILDVE